MAANAENPDPLELLEWLKDLDKRISRIEQRLSLDPSADSEWLPSEHMVSREEEGEPDAWEFRIGQFWLARAGIVVLIIGVAFLMAFPYQHLPRFIPIILGYVLTAALFGVSWFWRHSVQDIARCLLGGGMFLLYFSTLSLRFFGAQPLIEHLFPVWVALLMVVVANMAISVRCGSAFLAGLALTLGCITALIGTQPYWFLILMLGLSLLVALFVVRYRWDKLALYGTCLIYLTHAEWSINNPVMSHAFEWVTEPRFHVLFILAYGIILALAELLRGRRASEDDFSIVRSFFNCSGCYGLFLVCSVTAFRSTLAPLQLLASFVFLSLAIAFWVMNKSKFASFFYSMLGYGALTLAIIIKTGSPDVFVWLCWQSLLVISIAIWFRSKFIIVTNFFIFVAIFVAYLVMAGEVSSISLSFGFVALFSARILNWKQHRLELKTDLMRTAYLACVFFFFPYALWQLAPRQYVSLAWVGIALAYFLLSVLLKNKKYRWMALLTLLLTALYVIIVGVVRFEPAYRIASFIILGVVLLAVSFIYTRVRAREPEPKDDGPDPS